MAMEDAAVLVVGAGPTGLVLAVELARRDVPIRLIDRNPQPLSWDRATIVKPRTLEALDHMGLSDRFVDRGLAMRRVGLFAGSTRLAAVAYGGLDTPFPFLLSLPESETEAILTERLTELGGTVERGVELVGLSPMGEAVEVRLRDIADRRERTDRVGWVVGTDGLHSAVRSAVADAFEGHDSPTLWGVVDGRLASWRHAPNEVAIHLPQPWIMAAPLPDGRWRVYFRPTFADECSLAEVERGLSSMSPGAALVERDEPRFFHTHARVARRFRVGRVLVAGDAAHASSPVEGHGLNMGIQDAHNLAWKLALEVRGEAAPGLLGSYQAERRPVIEALVASGYEAETRLAVQDPEAWRGIAAALATPERNRAAAVADAETALGYDNSPIVNGDASAPAADATPLGYHVGDVAGLETREGARRLYDLLRTPVHVLLVLCGRTATGEDVRRAVAVADRFRPNLEVRVVGTENMNGDVHDPDGELHRRLGIVDSGLCVVRPDGYLGFRAAGLATDRLDTHMRQTLAAPAAGAVGNG